MTLLASLTRQLENPYLSRNQRAELRCQTAKELEEIGDYEGACEALGELWRGVGVKPQLVEVLSRSTAAEVLLRVGTLTGWIGQAQEAAKNLITEASRIFESLTYQKKVLEAQTELAYCYWREGAYDEARVILKGVIDQLTADSELKAKAVLRSAIVEWSSLRYSDSLCILTGAASLFERVNNHTIKGGYHNALAGVLEELGAAEKREDYTDRAFVEYEAAAYHFEQAKHHRYRANVENNLGFLYFKVGKYEEAHAHLDRARRILINLKDRGTVAQMDETRARVFLAQERYADAERAAKAAVRGLEESDRRALLSQALTTHGAALARLGSYKLARAALFRAVEVAHQSGAGNDAGTAGLTILEELSGSLTAEETRAVYQQAYKWLSDSQHVQTLRRLLRAANQVLNAGSDGREADKTPRAEAQGTLREMMRSYEREIIRQALRRSEGSITQAARLLGVSYQSLAHTIECRHKDLLHERSPIKRRRRSILKRRRD